MNLLENYNESLGKELISNSIEKNTIIYNKRIAKQAMIFYLCFSFITLILGLINIHEFQNIFEKEINYGDICKGKRLCNITFEIQEDITDIFYVYYKLTSFYQNNYLYSRSFKLSLPGRKVSKLCYQFVQNESNFKFNTYIPCGALPMSIFNDSFKLEGFSDSIRENSINPNYFKYLVKTPNDSYNISDLLLVKSPMFNQHFLNWVQISPFPTFRKLWGKNDKSTILRKGKHKITINNNYPVNSFGSKSLIISTIKWIGGKNNFFGILFLVISCSSLLLSLVHLLSTTKLRKRRGYIIFN